MDLTFNFAENSKNLANLEVEQNYSVCDIGDFEDITQYTMENKEINLQIPAKIFLNKALNLTGAEISFGSLPAEIDYVSNHKHKENEEIYIILSGKGSIKIEEREINLQKGSIVKVKTGVARAMKSSKNEAITYLCIQVKEDSLENYTLTDAEML